MLESVATKPLGEVVKAIYGVNEQAIDTAIAEQRRSGGRLGEILVAQGAISEEQLSACIALILARERTFFSHAFFAPLSGRRFGRHIQLGLESGIVCLLSLAITHWALHLPQAGLLALFLASAVITSRFDAALTQARASAVALDALSVFSGVLGAFCLVGLALDESAIARAYGLFLEIARIGAGDGIESGRFTDFSALLGNNAMVLASVVVLSFFYRSFGVLLVLLWNACVWGLSLTILVANADSGTAGALFRAVIGIGPHLALEALGYITAAVATIDLSKRALQGHGRNSLRQRLRPIAVLGLAVGIMV